VEMYDNRSERGGRPNIDEIVMVKMLVFAIMVRFIMILSLKGKQMIEFRFKNF